MTQAIESINRVGGPAVLARSAPASGGSDVAAIVAQQAATSGAGPAVLAISGNPDVGVVIIRGAGMLLDLQNRSGVTVFSVSEVGGITHTGITGDLNVIAGDLVITTVGHGINIREGVDARMGVVTINGAAAATVSTTAVTANSRIFLSHNAGIGTPAVVWVSARIPGTSFEITGIGLDKSDIAWLIMEPAA